MSSPHANRELQIVTPLILHLQSLTQHPLQSILSWSLILSAGPQSSMWPPPKPPSLCALDRRRWLLVLLNSFDACRGLRNPAEHFALSASRLPSLSQICSLYVLYPMTVICYTHLWSCMMPGLHARRGGQWILFIHPFPLIWWGAGWRKEQFNKRQKLFLGERRTAAPLILIPPVLGLSYTLQFCIW